MRKEIFVAIKSWEICIHFNKSCNEKLHLCTSTLKSSGLL